MTEPPKTKSGSHPAVVAHRKKLESLANIEDELQKIASDSSRPPKDPRRDGDEEIPVDVVDVPDLESIVDDEDTPTPVTKKEVP